MLFSGPLYYSTIKMNQLLIQTSTSMDFQGIMLSKKKKANQLDCIFLIFIYVTLLK